MIRVSFLLAGLVSLSFVTAARSDAYSDDATINALAGVYDLQVTADQAQGCRLALSREPVIRRDGRVLRPVDLGSCGQTFSSLRGITHWEATGGASIALFGGNPLSEASDFSPVQDGTGVYLRGGFAGDARIYELRPLSE